MGRRLSLAYPRTALTCVLLLAALAIPCGAWLVSGLRHVDRSTELAEAAVYSEGEQTAALLAEELSERLETLRRQESRRPFYHYQNLFHDPKGAAEGAAVTISPLAQGPTDPMLEVHFQLDADGHLGLPTLNERFPELGLDAGANAQCELLWELRDMVSLGELGDESVGTETSPSVATEPWSFATGTEVVVEELAGTAWHQHLRANEVYGDLKDGRTPSDLDEGSAEDAVEVSVSPFRWVALVLDSRPRLGALRQVDTPEGPWTQGFLLSECTVEQILENSDFPATFEPVDGDSAGDERKVAWPVDGTPWQVSVDVSAQLLAATHDSGVDRTVFLRTFTLGALGASIAGILILAVVFHSERLAQQRAQFAAAAAHELRTPLAGLRLYGEMLSEGLGDPTRGREYARRLASEAERLGRVVTNVLSFSRLEQGGQTLHVELGDLGHAVREAYERQRQALENSGAEIELHLDDDLPAIAFDRDAIGHIVQNLLDNAEKYTRDVADRKIVLSVREEAKQVVLSVADNGRGLSKSLRRRLFRPFHRGVGEGAPEGLGLGLVLVRMLARAQGAEISYRDAPSGGAVFRVVFPAARAAVQGEPALAS